MATVDNRMSIYENTEELFNTFGLAVITDAYRIEVKQVVNGEHSLRFTMPRKSKSYKHLRVGRFIKAYNTIYIIRSYEEYSHPPLLEVEVSCEHIMFELLDEIMPKTNHVKAPLGTVLTDITNGTRFTPSNSIEGQFSLQLERGSRLENLDKICESAKGIRLCSPMPNSSGMFTLTVIPNEGVPKGYLVHNRKNLNSMTRHVDGKKIITRLYPYGADGLNISKARASAGKLYIDGDSIKDYPKPKEGSVVFNDINDPNNLYEAGVKYLKGVQKPVVRYTVEMEDLKKNITRTVTADKSDLNIGDLIQVVDEDLEVTIKAKVTELTWLPEKGNIDVSLDALRPSLDELIADIVQAQAETETGIRTGNVWTEFVTIPFKNEKQTILFGQKYKTKPVIQVQVYGTSEIIPTLLEVIEEINEGITIYTGVNITCSTGTGTDIAVNAMGRV